LPTAVGVPGAPVSLSPRGAGSLSRAALVTDIKESLETPGLLFLDAI
jgi:hypothetical protein